MELLTEVNLVKNCIYTNVHEIGEIIPCKILDARDVKNLSQISELRYGSEVEYLRISILCYEPYENGWSLYKNIRYQLRS